MSGVAGAEAPSPAAGVVADQTWEQVLAALEEDIRRTERTMRAPVEVSDAVLAAQPAPSQTRLPQPVPLPSMPPAYAMPPISPEVEERIRELRVRIVALQLQLRDELALLRTSTLVTAPRLAPLADAGRPQFIDSRV